MQQVNAIDNAIPVIISVCEQCITGFVLCKEQQVYGDYIKTCTGRKTLCTNKCRYTTPQDYRVSAAEPVVSSLDHSAGEAV